MRKVVAFIKSEVVLTVAVLMQHGKSHGLSGTIAGGAETFFGKAKGKSMDAMFNKLTTIISIIFVVLVVALYIFLSIFGDSNGVINTFVQHFPKREISLGLFVNI